MPWFKVDDQLAFNSKVMLAGNAAMGLWVRAGSWSSAQLTDGFIPEHMANAMASAMANGCEADALVDAGLWLTVEGGYQFHDWSDFQPDADQERKKRKARSDAGKAGAAARWGKQTDSKPHGKPIANAMANECDRNAPSRPVPSYKEEANASSLGAQQAAAPPRPRSKRGTRLADDWIPSEALRDAMAAECPHVDQRAQFARFRDHWFAQPGQRGVKTDWDATYRNWIRRAADDAPRTTAQRTARPNKADRAQQAIQAGIDLERMLADAGQGNRELTWEGGTR